MMSHDAQTILLVDDEMMVRRLLGDALIAAGYRVRTAADRAEALIWLAREPVDLVLLDLRLGDDDGIAVLDRLRRDWPILPVIILTAHGSLPSAIAALRHEVADYLLKPIGLDELRRTVAAVLAKANARRQPHELLETMYRQLQSVIAEQPSSHRSRSVGEVLSPPAIYRVGNLSLDIDQHIVKRDGAIIELTPTEFAILAELLRRPGAVISCSQLMQAAQQIELDEEEARQMIRPHIVRLRRKIELDPQQPSAILSVRGLGYRWATED